jgi:hypothetical protein
MATESMNWPENHFLAAKYFGALLLKSLIDSFGA